MGNFEDWHVAGAQYAADHPELGLWEFQITAMSSDFAWRMEGAEITSENVQRAYEDWISGNNPYSVHTVRLEGYDQQESWRRLKVIAEDEFREFGRSKGIEEWQLDRFVADMHVELYFRKDEAEKKYGWWIKGSRFSWGRSPYFVPFDPVNVAERAERLGVMRERYPMKNWQAQIWFPDADQYGSIEDSKYLRKYAVDAAADS